MSPKDLQELKINALALRNIAGKVLEQVERLEKKEYRSTNQSKKAGRKSWKQIYLSAFTQAGESQY